MDPQDDAQLVRQAARRMALTRSFVFIVYRSRCSAQNAVVSSKITLVQKKDKRKECQPGHGPLRGEEKGILDRSTPAGRASFQSAIRCARTLHYDPHRAAFTAGPGLV
jgi:hypothetical protein